MALVLVHVVWFVACCVSRRWVLLPIDRSANWAKSASRVTTVEAEVTNTSVRLADESSASSSVS